MRNRWRISAGVVDAGLASFATFGIGFFAIRYFAPADLGGYALAFAAFKLAVFIPQELIFLPAEVAAVSRASATRLGLLGNTLRLGFLPALFAALLVSVWALAAPDGISPDAAVAFTWSAMACTLVSPMQDHLRRLLHIAGRSWLAAFVSVMQSVTMLIAIVTMLRFGIAAPWIPFGALALANVVSISVGGVLSQRGASRPGREELLRFDELARAGGWFLFGSLMAPASAFLASVLVSHLASAAALGYAEAARIIGRPLQVFALGISTVLSRQSVDAAHKRNLGNARRMSRMHIRLMVGCGVLYLAAAGFDVPWNPLAHFLPNAYAIAGLAAFTILADVVTVVLLPQRYELLGGRRARELSRIEAGAATLRTLAAATAPVTHAFAMSIGQFALGTARWIGYRRELRQLYSSPPTASPPTAVATGADLRPVA